MREIFQSIGPTKAPGLSFFHAFSGCDSVSSFSNIGKKTAWALAKTDNTLTELSAFPETITETISNIEEYTVLMYD